MSYQGYGTRGAHDRRAQVAQALMASSVQRTPQNVGEGIGAVGRALFGMLASRANSRQEQEGQSAAVSRRIDPIVAAMTAQGDPMASAFGAPAPAAPPATSPIEMQPSPPPSGGFDLDRIERGLDDPVMASAQAAGIDPEAWRRQIQVESGGNATAVSPAGATGIAQIMPATARDPGFGVPTIFEVARQLGRQVPDESDATKQALLRDPQVNATFGALYQRAMLEQHGGDPTLAAAAYNAGPGAVQRAGGVPNFAETQNYVRNVQPRLAGSAAQPAAQPAMAQPQGNSRADLIPLLMQAAGDDWLPEGQRQVVNALLQRELAGSPEGTSAMREYELARQQGFQGSFLDYRTALAQAGGTRVNVNTGDQGQRIGNIPAGFTAVPDPSNPSGFRMEAIPGGPVTREDDAAAEAARIRQQNVETAGGTVIQDIGRALEMLQDHRAFTVGPGAALASNIPGSPARVVQQMVDSIKSNIGVDQLQRMRDASPTGGALGNVTERQLEGLQSLLGSLDITQPPQVIEDNLKRIANLYNDLIHGPGQGPQRFRLSFDAQGRPLPDSPPPAAAPAPPAAPAQGGVLRYNPETDELEPVE